MLNKVSTVLLLLAVLYYQDVISVHRVARSPQNTGAMQNQTGGMGPGQAPDASAMQNQTGGMNQMGGGGAPDATAMQNQTGGMNQMGGGGGAAPDASAMQNQTGGVGQMGPPDTSNIGMGKKP